MGAFEDGSTFLAGVLAKLPEAARAQVKTVFDSPEAKDAVILVGDGALARSDYSKSQDALKAEREKLQAKFTELNDWYKANEAALKEYPTLKAKVDKGGNEPPEPNPDDLKIPTADDIFATAMKAIDQAGPEYIGIAAWFDDRRAEHESLFQGKVPFSAREIQANPKLGKPIAGQPGRVFSLDDSYNELYGEKVTARRKELDDQRINAEVEKRMTEERKKLVGQPFPLRGGAEPSVLDVLQTKDGTQAHTVDSATEHYERLQAARNGIPA